VSATEAAKRLGALVDRVRDERAAYTIERGGTAVARLEPVESRRCTLRDLATLLHDISRPDAGYLDEVERAVADFNRPALPGTPWGS
jgi:antitoxin (DNA-binding transcriptional repressor) of toxin-antitoxin stability system